MTRLQEVHSTTNLDARRLVHGRGKTFPGLEQINIDWFYPLLLITEFDPSTAIDWYDFAQTLVNENGHLVNCVVIQRRHLPGAPSEVLVGEVPEPHFAIRQGLKFELSLLKQQNIGFFLDMEPGRLWLEGLTKGKNVLNLFAYTCAFSVVAQAAGARQIVNVDMSRPALTRGRANHRHNQQPTDNIIFLQENILKSWGRIKKHGPYDVIIFDPPSFQKGSFIAERDYQKLVRRIPELAADKCDILACLNAPEVPRKFIEDRFSEVDVNCTLVSALAGSSDFPDTSPDLALKLLHYQWG
jgi:23S rRNA (cytosine1962-C5)-methyltransferase